MDFVRGQRERMINCEIVLDILEGQKRRGAAKAAKTTGNVAHPEREERTIFATGEEHKKRNFGLSGGGRGPARCGPAEGRSGRENGKKTNFQKIKNIEKFQETLCKIQKTNNMRKHKSKKIPKKIKKELRKIMMSKKKCKGKINSKGRSPKTSKIKYLKERERE